MLHEQVTYPELPPSQIFFSLIQTLYMSPEFRTALYKWDFNDYYEKRKADYKPENLDIKGNDHWMLLIII